MEYLLSGWLWWPLLLVFFLTLIYLAAPLIAWMLGGIALLGLFAQFADVSWLAKLVVWVLYLAPMIVLGIPLLRCRVLGEPVFRLYRSSMPAISATEQAALDAGTTWWDAELFSGRPHWRRLLKAKPASLDDEEIDFLNGPVEELCALINDYDVNIGSRDLPAAAWDLLRKAGFFGMVIPHQYGGKGFSQYGHAAVVMKVASRSIAGALTIMIPNSVGPGKLLLKYGTEEQKNYYLPRLASGQEIPCFALTSPEAGSDAGSIPDSGIVCKQDYQGKKDVLGIRLNFDKRYISLAPVATLIGVAFKLYDPDQLLGDRENLGITVALVPADTPGIEIGSRHDPLHMGFHNGPVRGVDLFVPIDAIIGGAAQAGNGWRMLMESLSDGRSISLPALTTGSAKLATRATGAYARLRYQFKTYIGTFEGVQAALARIAGNTYAMDAARTVTLGALDEGHKPAVIAAIVKYNLTERNRQVMNDAMDVHGGAGVCLGPRNIIGEYAKFPSLGITVEGHNILTRSMMTFGQGVVRCHPYFRSEIEAASNADEHAGLMSFDKVLVKHLGFAASNAVRSLLHAWTGSLLVPAARKLGPLRRYYRQLSRMSAAFAFTTDILLMFLRGELKRREMLSGRMADIISQLYIASTVLKHFDNHQHDETELQVAQWAVQDCLHRIERAFGEVFDNFPSRWVGRLLKRWIFPFGRTYKKPSDELERCIAESIVIPSVIRERLTQGMYVTDDIDTQLGRLEHALQRVIAIQPLEAKLKEGQRIDLVSGHSLAERIDNAVAARLFTEEEAEQLRKAEAARLDALKVDDWEF